MLAKDIISPRHPCFAILDIDAGLLSVDIRAPERTAQLIVQVAGRAGRGNTKAMSICKAYAQIIPLC